MRLDIKLLKSTRLVVVSDIHEHEEQIDKLLAEVKPSANNIIVSVGDVYDKGFGSDIAESITDKFMKLVDEGFAYVVKGNHELNNIRRAEQKKQMTDQLKWWDNQPLSLSFMFENHSKVTIVHGGVLPSHTWEDLASSIDMCYVRYVDKDGKYIKRLKTEQDGMCIMVNERPGTIWHDLYDGRFGYIVSGHNSQKDGIPKFYNYSCNIDAAVYHTGKLVAQAFVDGTREELLIFTGAPKYPDLNEMYRLMNRGRI